MFENSGVENPFSFTLRYAKDQLNVCIFPIFSRHKLIDGEEVRENVELVSHLSCHIDKGMDAFFGTSYFFCPKILRI